MIDGLQEAEGFLCSPGTRLVLLAPGPPVQFEGFIGAD